MGTIKGNLRGKNRLISPELVEEAVSYATKFDLSLILSPTTDRDIRSARRLLYRAIYRYSGLPLTSIGERYGVDFSNVSRKIIRVDRELDRDTKLFSSDVAAIWEEITFQVVLRRKHKLSKASKVVYTRDAWLETLGLNRVDWFKMSYKEQLALKQANDYNGFFESYVIPINQP